MEASIIDIKVLFLSESLQLSGSTTWMNSLITAFQKAGIPCAHLVISIVTEIESAADKVYYTGRAREHFPLRIMRFFQFHKIFYKYYKLQEDLFFDKYVKSILKDNNEDILVIKDFNSYLPKVLECKQFTVVSVMHNQFFNYEPGYYRDYLISVSRAVMRNSNEAGFNVDGFIYNPLDIEDVKIKSVKYEPNENNFLLFAGKIHKEKGVLHLLKAYHELLKEGKINHKLVYLGSGKDQRLLEEYVSKHDLEDNVIFKGFVNNPYPYIKKAKLLVLPSYSEAMPYVAIEAAVLETSYLVSDFSGAEEFYPSSNIFCMHSDPNIFNRNLKCKILDLLKTPRYSLKEEVLEKINPQEVVHSYCKFLKERS